MRYHYTYDDLVNCFKALKFSNEHEAIFISGDLGKLGLGEFGNREQYLVSLLNSLVDVFGDSTTIMTSTFTHDLVNTDKVFDKKTTPSMHGAVANFFIKHSRSVRSSHPFTSFCAIGPKAEYLCGEDLIHPYGIDSPYDKLLSLKNPLTISLGLPPNITCSLVHHAEVVMNVPYRYIKEFPHKVMQNGVGVEKSYCLPVVYREVEATRNKNVRIFEEFQTRKSVKETDVGRGKIYSYQTNELFKSMVAQFKKNIYCWFDSPPKNRPYRK